MSDLIYKQAAIDEAQYEIEMINHALDSLTLDFNARERLRQRKGEAREILNSIQALPTVDAILVVRCRDCKHRPTGENRYDLEFPDEICPCQCDDFWYNWKPADNWFCGNGERKDGERHEG